MADDIPSPAEPGSHLTETERPSDKPTIDVRQQLTTQEACLKFLTKEGFQSVRFVKAGSEGWVFYAADRLHDSVAIKIPKFGSGKYQDRIDRLIREARILKQFNEVPQIINAWYCGPPQTPCYSLLRWIEEGQKCAATAGSQSRVEAAARIVGDIAGALAHVHRDGVIHRDIKPDNILVDTDGRGWLTDFGIAQVGSEAGPGLGTVGYFPLEQLTPGKISGLLEPSVDVFALGAVLFELLTGQLPFAAPTIEEYALLLQGRPPVVWPNGKPPKLAKLCEQMLAHDPRVRPTAEAVFEQLKRYQPIASPRTATVASGPERLLMPELPGIVPAFVGRSQLLDELNRLAQPRSAVKVVCICGQTGQGKTALVNQWLRNLAGQTPSWLGFERVLIWTFKKQRSRDNVALGAMTTEEFADKAFQVLHEPKKKRHEDAVARGGRLAELLKKRRTLVVLDGIELFQSHDSDPLLGHFYGECTDQFLAGFLEGLVHADNVFCLTTAQLPLTELSAWDGRGFQQLLLEPLSADESVALLQEHGCVDDTATLAKLCEKFHRRPADLALLGKYVRNVHDGHASQVEAELSRLSREMISSSVDDQTSGVIWRSLLSSYQDWQSRMGQGPDADLLKVACLFNRPVPVEWLRQFLSQDAIPGLTDRLATIEPRELHRRLNRLEQFGLLEPTRPNQSDRIIDVPPLVREVFAGQLAREAPNVWQAAHRSLFDLLAAPTFVQGLSEAAAVDILITAIWHGCQAGAIQDAWRLHQVRLNRHEYDPSGQLISHRHYLRNTLGAPELELAALLNFCTRPWEPLPELSVTDQSDILLSAAILLRAQGEMSAAAVQFQRALNRFLELADHPRAVSAARHLSQLYLATGQMAEAVKYAQQGRAIADQHPKSINSFERIEALATLGDVWHHVGDFEQARAVFEQAEFWQSTRQPWPKLHRLAGVRYGQFLLSQGQAHEVLQRFDDPRVEEIHKPFVLARGLTRLLVCQAKLWLARAASAPHSPELIDKSLALSADYDDALRLVDESHQFQFIADGLLSRAEARRCAGRWNDADDDLRKARALIDHKGFRRMLADWHLEQAELCLDRNLFEKQAPGSLLESAHRECQNARELIRSMSSYRRRDVALANLEKRLHEWAGQNSDDMHAG